MNEVLKFLEKFKKKKYFFFFWGGGSGGGGGGRGRVGRSQGGCEQRIEVFVKIKKKKFIGGVGLEGGSEWM